MNWADTAALVRFSDRPITLNSADNEKKYAEIFLRYRRLFVKGDVFIGKWEIFGAKVFLCYS